MRIYFSVMKNNQQSFVSFEGDNGNLISEELKKQFDQVQEITKEDYFLMMTKLTEIND